MAVPTTTPLHELTVQDAARLIGAGDLSPMTYLEACLDRIAAVDPRVRAWSYLDIQEARAQAEVLAAEARTGRLRGPLHGIPTGVKEEFAVRNMPDTSEPNLPPGPASAQDATAVARLRAAGAIVLGKLFMPGRSGNPPTRNPWNLEHTAGGTSSGSGAAVGSRMVPFTLGEQTFGSNLRPAAFCGVSGLKPTFGRVSRAGMWAFSYSQDHPGVIGLNMADIALVLSVISGHDPLDPTSLPLSAPSPQLSKDQLRPPRIGLVRNFFPERTQPAMQATVDTAAGRLAAAGAVVKDVQLPDEFGLVWHTHQLVLRAEGAAINAARNARAIAAGEEHSFAAGRLGANRLGELIPSAYYLQGQRLRRRLIRSTSDFFQSQDLDVLLTAIAPGPAPRGLDSTGDPVLLAPWSHLGFPAICVQSGQRSPEGLPLGLQFAAVPRADHNLLGWGAWMERVLGYLPAPPL
jgi:aspartyl-tRNA(Asn)/glutamyl-tRNA(Gln) amidotransferase subunit A